MSKAQTLGWVAEAPFVGSRREEMVLEPAVRLQALFEANYDLVWRLIRRLGVPAAAVDDAAQDAFLVVARRIQEIRSGCERAFLFNTAVRIAAEARRTAKRSALGVPDASELLEDGRSGPDEMIDFSRMRALCDRVLDQMPIELRTVFVLFQVEEMTMAEIAECLSIPAGTVASRLRRARELFDGEIAKLEGRRGAR